MKMTIFQFIFVYLMYIMALLYVFFISKVHFQTTYDIRNKLPTIEVNIRSVVKISRSGFYD